MKLVASKDFKWAHDHVRVVEYKAGEAFDTDDEDLIRVAISEEGWAAEEGSKEAKKAKTAAPENKDAGGSPENK